MSNVSARSAVVLGAMVLALALSACGEGASQPPQAAPPPPPVTVAKPVQRTVTEQDEYVGRFVAVDTVEMRARVSGYLEGVHFTDGQIVRDGDLLFSIDRRPFENTLAHAQANLTQARANLAYAESDLERGNQLVRDKTITQQTFEQRTQAKRVTEAAVAAQEAAVRQASLDLEFTELRAPVSGRIGDRRVSPGNLVMGGTSATPTLLAMIMSIDPIRFEFTVDEASYLRYERLARQGGDVASRHGGAAVSLKLIDEPEFVHKGRLDFIDNAIDRASGTIRGRAVFENPSGVFTPGMFARLRVPGSRPYQALLVPDVAIASEQTRKYVLTVADDGTVQQKYVTLGPAMGHLRVVKEGISADERVIVNGLMRARPGQKVTPQEQGALLGPGRPSAEAGSPRAN
ncbi:MAG TPA: efflux RND transporter periplasmic adaptor subunit [Xanthobacteraceae bacterium]